MKKYSIFSTIAVMVLAAVSCNKEMTPEENTGKGNTVRVTVTTAPELAMDTRTVINQDPSNPNLYIPSWLGNEKMGIWVDNVPSSGSVQPDFLTNSTAGETAAFTGEISIEAGQHTIYGYASSADKYVNKYYKETDKSLVGFDVPQVQHPTLTSFDSDADLLIAKAQTVEIGDGQSELNIENVQFSRALAVLQVILKDDSSKGVKGNAVVKSISLTPSNVNDEPLTGRAKIDVANGGVISGFTTYNGVTAEYADDSFVINDENSAWFVVNPLTFGESSTLTLSADAGKYVISKTLNVSGIELKRGDIVTFDVSLTDDDVTVMEAGLALPFEDDFSEAIKGSISSSSTPWEQSSSSQFVLEGKVYQAGNAIKLASGSDSGSITTKSALDLSQPFTVIVAGTGWDADELSLDITAGNQTQTVTFATHINAGKNEVYEFDYQYAYFEAETNMTKVSFYAAKGKRIFIDNIEIVSGDQRPAAELKSVETFNAVVTGETSAILKGAYNAVYVGADDVVKYGFEWGTDASSLTSVDASDAVDGEFSYDLTGLTTGTTYTFKAWARLNDGEKVYGEAMTFVPKAPAYYYQKVAAVTSGKSYLIVAENGGKYYLAKPVASSSSYDYLEVAEITVESGDVIYESEIASDENSFVIEGTAGNYTICQPDGRYFWQDGSFNTISVDNSPSSGQYWTIEAQGDGTMKITNNEKNKFIQYDPGYTSYGSYSDSKGVMPYLFEKVE